MTAHIFDIQRFCVHDGPGIRTTVFMKGCPLRCKWCHNPESQVPSKQLLFYKNKCVNCGKCSDICTARSFDGSVSISREKCTLCGKCTEICPVKANTVVGKIADTEEIMTAVLSDVLFYKKIGGLTLSGGEPSMQQEASLELIKLAKENNINTVIETSGYGNKDFFKQANDLGALFYYDIKALDDNKHKALCGVSNKRIIDNLLFLFSENANVVIRLPLIPGINDSDNDLLLLKEFLYENKNKYKECQIMKYHNLGSTKSRALDKEYEMSMENATDNDVARWLELTDYKTNNVILSH